jgi:serine-type D-Ala-D-Ala carboxypeptidase
LCANIVIIEISSYSQIRVPMRAIKEINEFLQSSIAAREFAGAVYLIAEGEQIHALGACGDAVVVPHKIAAHEQTIFDLASLTKPLITGLLLGHFIETDRIALRQPISEILPQFRTTEKAALTIGEVAAHNAGFAAWRPFYALANTRAEVLDMIASQPLEYAPGTRVIYSDPGYITLGFLLAAVAGKPLDEIVRQIIATPLGLTRTCFNPPGHWQAEIAASEIGNQFEKKLAGAEAAHYQGWREYPIWGEVHDQNAYFLGGVAGHAGLFSTAREVYRLARQFLPGSQLLKAATLPLFHNSLTPDAVEARSLGWQLAAVGITSAGDALAPESFGHIGFTGTSIWIEPATARIYILLTNRTHPNYWEFNINERRRRFHQLAQAVFPR